MFLTPDLILSLREKSVSYALSLNGGSHMDVKKLIEDADEIYFYLTEHLTTGTGIAQQ